MAGETQTAVNELRIALARMETKMAQLENLTQRGIAISEENSRALRGTNGEPGLMADVASLSDKIGDHLNTDPNRDLMMAIYGDPKDREARPGLIVDIRDLKLWKGKFEKLYWLVVAAIVAGTANFVLNILESLRIGVIK